MKGFKFVRVVNRKDCEGEFWSLQIRSYPVDRIRAAGTNPSGELTISSHGQLLGSFGTNFFGKAEKMTGKKMFVLKLKYLHDFERGNRGTANPIGRQAGSTTAPGRNLER